MHLNLNIGPNLKSTLVWEYYIHIILQFLSPYLAVICHTRNVYILETRAIEYTCSLRASLPSTAAGRRQLFDFVAPKQWLCAQNALGMM